MNQTSSIIAGGTFILFFGAALGWGMNNNWFSDPDLPATTKNVAEAYQVIRSRYVDPVSPDSLTKQAIRGFVSGLDPYSSYIGRERMDRVQEMMRGSFEGIGISYELVDGPRGQDTIFVSTVVPDGPSEAAGLLPGDRIVAVEGESAVGWSRERIRSRLMGPEGTTVKIKAQRPGRTSPFRTRIERGQVPVQTVEAVYMMNDTTGYLRLRRFSETTHQELSQGLRQLKNSGMRRFILDLRGNDGGLMSEAREVADEFLTEDQLIVSARSSHNGYSEAWYAEAAGALQEEPLIVLVDEQTASASEIVAGSLQDHDRALIVGRRTFGKGLVQRQFNFDDGSGLRLTIARYYAPSGRLLQHPYDTSSSGSVTTASRPTDSRRDSNSTVHRTDAGRIVKEGGGIQPDVVVNPDSAEGVHQLIVKHRDLIRAFARNWIDPRADSLRARWKTRPQVFLREYAPPPSVSTAFARYAETHGGSAIARKIQRPTGPVRSDTEAAGHERSSAEPPLRKSAPRYLRTVVLSYVARRIFGATKETRVRNTIDPVVSRAQDSWARAEGLASRYPIE